MFWDEGDLAELRGTAVVGRFCPVFLVIRDFSLTEDTNFSIQKK